MLKVNSLKAAWLRIKALMVKEFLLMWLDKGTRKILFIPIIVQCLIFGYGVTFNLEKIPYLLLDESHTPQSVRLAGALHLNPLFELQRTCISQEDLVQSMAAGEGLIALHLPPEFAKTGEVYLIADARNTAAANTASAYLTELIAGLNAAQGTGQSALRLDYRYYYNEHNITRYSILTSMILALSLIQILLLASQTVAREREEGNFDMLLMTPATSVEILIGKAVPPAAAACLQSLILFLLCRFYFEIPLRGSFLLLCLTAILFAFAVVGVGMIVSVLARSAQQALITAFIIALPCVILSGLITPFAAMPQVLQLIVKCINPLYYGISALQRIYLAGAEFDEIYPLLLPLIICAGVTMPVTMRLFRRQLQ